MGNASLAVDLRPQAAPVHGEAGKLFLGIEDRNNPSLPEAQPRLKYDSPLALIEEFFDLIHLEHNAV
jgi:hypothetical protein